MTTQMAVDRPGAQQLPSYDTVRDFLYQEARLLDEQRWREWADLFTEDGDYWVPATPNQPDPVNHVSLIHENKLLREVRLRRFDNPEAHSLQPFPRSVHLISNVMIDRIDDVAGEIVTSSRFLMMVYRNDQTAMHGGSMEHRLTVESDSTLRIRRKRVDLINCDAAHETINLYF